MILASLLDTMIPPRRSKALTANTALLKRWTNAFLSIDVIWTFSFGALVGLDLPLDDGVPFFGDFGALGIADDEGSLDVCCR